MTDTGKTDAEADLLRSILGHRMTRPDVMAIEALARLIAREEIARASAGGGEAKPTPRVSISPVLEKVELFVGEEITCVRIPYGPWSVHKSEISLNFIDHDLAVRVAEALRACAAPSTTQAPETGEGEDDLHWQLLGRARFLRDRKEEKSPHLMEEAARALRAAEARIKGLEGEVSEWQARHLRMAEDCGTAEDALADIRERVGKAVATLRAVDDAPVDRVAEIGAYARRRAITILTDPSPTSAKDAQVQTQEGGGSDTRRSEVRAEDRGHIAQPARDTDTPAPALLPCPFCGEAARLYTQAERRAHMDYAPR